MMFTPYSERSPLGLLDSRGVSVLMSPHITMFSPTSRPDSGHTSSKEGSAHSIPCHDPYPSFMSPFRVPPTS